MDLDQQDPRVDRHRDKDQAGQGGGGPGHSHEHVIPPLGLLRGHSGATGAADSERRASSVSNTCWPYLASLLSPTPLTAPSSARVAGHRAANSRSVASWKIT